VNRKAIDGQVAARDRVDRCGEPDFVLVAAAVDVDRLDAAVGGLQALDVDDLPDEAGK
jgi:hypothetical protein